MTQGALKSCAKHMTCSGPLCKADARIQVGTRVQCPSESVRDPSEQRGKRRGQIPGTKAQKTEQS